MNSTSATPKTTEPIDLSKLSLRPLTGRACLDRFECGDSDINAYAQKAHKWVERGRTKAFGAHEGIAVWALGFYSLSLTVEEKRKIGTPQAQYFDFGVPLVYIDAIGVRRTYQGCGIGRMLLIDALRRVYRISQDVAVYGAALRSLNERTTAFYSKHGFGIIKEPNAKNPLMVVPIWTLNDLFSV